MKTKPTTRPGSFIEQTFYAFMKRLPGANPIGKGSCKVGKCLLFSFLIGFIPSAFGQQCDIVVQGAPGVAPNPATAGNNITVSYTIHNNGPANASASQTKIQIKNSSGTLITSSTFVAPAINAYANSVQQANSLTIPPGTPAGNYTAIVILDNQSQLNQSNTGNDYTPGVGFTVGAQQCDIVVQGAPGVAPNPATAGNNITVSYTIYNNGPANAGASQTKIQIKNSSGTLITSSTFAAPVINAYANSVQQANSLTIPPGTPAGNYTAIVILDNQSQLNQSNTGNDYTPGVGFTVGAQQCDIVVQGAPGVAPNPATAGNNITVSYTIYNNGPANAGASQTKIQIKNSSGTLITSSTFAAPVINAYANSVQQANSLTIPPGTPAGSYTAIVLLDNLTQLNQSNTGNDYTPAVGFTVGAQQCDIVVQGAPGVAPNPATAGNNITVSYTIYNNGPANAGASQTKIQIKNSSGTLITSSTFAAPVINAYANSVQQANSLTIPPGTPAGSYTAIVLLDNLTQLNQSNTGNDYTPAVGFTVGAQQCDIVVQGAPAIAPDSVTAGDNITVSYTIHNNGPANAGASQTKIQIKNSSGVLTTAPTFAAPAVNANANSAVQASVVAIPAGTPAGSYTAIVLLDNLTQLNQSNTGNDYTPGVGFTVGPPYVSTTDGFDYPIGARIRYTEGPNDAPDGDGWYVATEFNEYYSGNGKYHLGEDWNAESGGNTDYGLPIYSIANGTIIFAGPATVSGWGNVLIIRHKLPDGTLVESLYGHVASFLRTSGNVTRGEQVATIGDGGGLYYAHLHLEVRFSNCPYWGSEGVGYSVTQSPAGWTDPSDFIDAHRPTGTGPAPSITRVSPPTMPPSSANQTLTINGTDFQNGATLTFDPPTGPNIPSQAAKLTFVSSSQITYQLNNGDDLGPWTVTVNNPDGQSSSPASFTVVDGGGAGEPQSLGTIWIPSPNFEDRPANQVIDTIVVHTTEGSTAPSAIDTLLNRGLSAHYVIESTGQIYQLVDLSKRAWHATYYNNRSIGIEMVGYAGQASTWNAQNVGALENLVAYLVSKYNIQIVHPAGDACSYLDTWFTEMGLVGHSQIQPSPCYPKTVGGNTYDQKSDPGTYFPWATFVQAIQERIGTNATRTLSVSPLSLSFSSSPRSVVDLQVFYTPAAKTEAGGEANLLSEIAAAVKQSNEAYVNSRINHRMRLLSIEPVNYVEAASIGTDIDLLISNRIDSVHTARNISGADVVALVEASGYLGGISKTMHEDLHSFENKAFCIVRLPEMTNYFALPHEIGHIMGCGHDHAQADLDGADGIGVYPYSYGYLLPGNKYGDIMSYPAPSGASYIPYFSNPDVLYASIPTGVREDQPQPANTALTMNNTASTVAAFRNTVFAGNVITISNSSASQMTVTSISPETTAPWLSVSPQGPFSINPGTAQNVTVQVDYGLAPNGYSNVRLLIVTNNASANPILGGIAVIVDNDAPPPTPIISLSGNLAFGNVTVGSSAHATLMITNTGNSPLTVNSISYPVGFSGAWSGPIGAASSQPVTVTFAPTAAISYGNSLTVNSDATGNNTYVISGTGVPAPAVVALDASTLNQVYDGSPKVITASTTPPGLALTITYNDSTTPPTGAGNYTVVATINDPVYTGSAFGTLTVGPATLTVATDNKSRAYGAANPTFTGTFTGLLTGDNISASYNCAAASDSAVGIYDIVPNLNDPSGSLANYTVTLNKGQLTVTISETRIGTTSLDGQQFHVSLTTAPGANYSLEFKNSLADPNWTNAYTLPGSGGMITLTDGTATNSARFYRVRVQ